MKARKLKSKLTTMDKLKKILAHDKELVGILDDSVKRGFLTKNGNSTKKLEERSIGLESYCMYLATGRGFEKIKREKFKKKNK
jgi:hypothetical protein